MLEVRTQATATLDDKGRLSLPAPLRRALEVHRVHSLVLSCVRGAVWGWAPDVYKAKVEEPMSRLDAFADPVVDFVHGVLALNEEVEVDKTGRIRVPPEIRELAGLDKEIKLFSVLDRIEIWDHGRWRERFAQAQQRSAGAGGMSGLMPPVAPARPVGEGA